MIELVRWRGLPTSVVFSSEPAQTSFSPPFPPPNLCSPPSSEAAPQVSPIFFILKKWGGVRGGGKDDRGRLFILINNRFFIIYSEKWVERGAATLGVGKEQLR